MSQAMTTVARIARRNVTPERNTPTTDTEAVVVVVGAVTMTGFMIVCNCEAARREASMFVM